MSRFTTIPIVSPQQFERSTREEKPCRLARFRSLLVLPFVLGAFACGSDSEGATASSTTADPTTSAPDDTGSGADSAEWQGIIEAAKAEGSVTLYTSMAPQQVDALVVAFEEAYGISVEAIRGTPPEYQLSVETELESGRGIADVVDTPDTGWLDRMADGDSLVSLAELPSLAGADIRPEWIRNDGYVIVQRASPGGWGFNTDLVPDGIESCEGFLDPELKGRVGAIEPNAAYPVDVWKFMEETCGPDFLTELAEQEIRVFPGQLPIAEALASGEIAVGFPNAPSIQGALREAGAPIDASMAHPHVTASWTAIPKSAPHPNAALLLADFFNTREGNLSRGEFPLTLYTIRDLGSEAYLGEYEIRNPGQWDSEAVEAFNQSWSSLFR